MDSASPPPPDPAAVAAAIAAVEAMIHQLRILFCTLLPFACVVTYFRLYVRATRGKLWWDDFWIFLSTISAILMITGAMVSVSDPTKLTRTTKIAAYYMGSQFYYATNWTARISILFTVIRLAYGKLQKFLFVMAAAFGVAWAVLFAQVFWVCEGNPSWKDAIPPQCVLGRNVAIAQVVTDVISDAVLIAAPIRVLVRARLTRSLRIRLMSVFATTGITTAVSLYHAYELIRGGGLDELRAAAIQAAIGLLVANLGVVVAFLFNLKQDQDDNTAIRTFGSRKKSELSAMEFGARSRLPTNASQSTTVQVRIEKDRWGQSITAVDGKSMPSSGASDMELNDMNYKAKPDDA